MSRIFILLLCCFLFTNSSFGQTYSSIVSDKEIYEFLNWMVLNEEEQTFFKDKRIDNKIESWDIHYLTQDTALLKPSKFYDSSWYIFSRASSLDTIFTEKERTFLLQEINCFKDSIWHKPFPNSELKKKKTKKRFNIHSYSIPLFSIDRKYVIISTSYTSFLNWSSGGIFLYKKIGQYEWEFVSKVKSWATATE